MRLIILGSGGYDRTVAEECVIGEGRHICLRAIVRGENRVKWLTKIEVGEVIESRKWLIAH